jgi:EAL and modified HD-GYP domain-containing signal transduction protein
VSPQGKEKGLVEKLIARQPIFNSKRAISSYEPLHRSSLENYFAGVDLDHASVSTADSVFLSGLERLAHGHRAFLNCTHDFLISNYATLLPKDAAVIEVLENVKVDDELLSACQRLKHSGYLIALDDFQETPEWQPLIALADFIKVDILATSEEEQLRLAREFRNTSVRLLAEKVETYDEFQRTLDWGYDFFRGISSAARWFSHTTTFPRAS